MIAILSLFKNQKKRDVMVRTAESTDIRLNHDLTCKSKLTEGLLVEITATDGNNLFQRLDLLANEIIWNNMQLHILVGYVMMQSDVQYIAPHYRTGRKHGI
jgi:DUF1680 family protein